MQLEWFRKHKDFVYYVMLPIMAGSMGLLGSGAACSRGHFGGGTSGPALEINSQGDHKISLSPAETLSLRTQLSSFMGGRNNTSSQEAGMHLAQYNYALDRGFEVGEKELVRQISEYIKMQVQMRDRSQDEVRVNQELYDKLLAMLHMSPSQFEELVRELAVSGKLSQFMNGQLKTSEPELYAAYCRDKENVRVRYVEFKSEDFLAKAKAPEAADIEKYYNSNKDNKKDEAAKATLYSPAKLSSDVFFLDTASFFKTEKPTDAQLKETYDRVKATKPEWKDGDTKPGEAPKFKPLETVKDEVVKQFETDQTNKQRSEAYTMSSMFRDAFVKAEKAYNETESKKPEAERKPFDIDKWIADSAKEQLEKAEKTHNDNETAKETAAKNAKPTDGKPVVPYERKPFDRNKWTEQYKFSHWTTDELTESEFKAGKNEKNAKNFSLIGELFSLLNTPDDAPQQTRENNERNLTSLSYMRFVDNDKLENGAYFRRTKNITREKLLTQEEAKANITARLTAENAAKAAKEAADAARKDWIDGKNIPALDSMKEAAGKRTDYENRNPALQQFFQKPAGLGEPFEVAESSADEDDPKNPPAKRTSPHRRYYVGFAVERTLPDYQAFQKDEEWSRDMPKRMLDYALQNNFKKANDDQLKTLSVTVGNMADPPLYSRTQNQE